MVRFCASGGVSSAVQQVEMLWVDKNGFDARAILTDGMARIVRVPFSRPVCPPRSLLRRPAPALPLVIRSCFCGTCCCARAASGHARPAAAARPLCRRV